MSRRRRTTVLLATFSALAILVSAGYLVVHARASGGRTLQSMAGVSLPSPSPSSRAAPIRWLVAEPRREVTAYRRPSVSAPVRATLARLNPNGYPTLMLVREVRQVNGVTWYCVSIASRPRGMRAWVEAARLGTYSTDAEIEIDISARRLSVYVGGRLRGRFPVAVGSSAYPTPTGSFFVDEKFRPSPSTGAYGVMALGLSAFQPRLPTLGSLAIHGTNDPALIGQSVSDGCIRMRNADVLRVGAWVPAGSPVVIRP
jgi:hypothetical protein